MGVDFGGTRIKFASVIGGKIDRLVVLDTPKNNSAALLRSIADGVKAFQAQPVSVGVAIPGEVDEDGICWRLPNVTGFEGVPISRELEKLWGCPVRIENDGTSAALAESKFGYGLQFQDFLVVTLGTGVGGGLVLGGQARRGHLGFAAEIGHILIDRSATAWLCHCGKTGCIESYASTRALLRYYSEAGGSANSVEELARAARDGDAEATESFRRAGKALGMGLCSAQHLLDLDALIFTGGISAAFDLMTDSVREGLRARAFAPPLSELPLLVSELGPHAGVIGAAWLPSHFEGPRS